MTIPIPIIGVRCHYCSQFFREQDVIRYGESIVRCHKCQEKHTAALEVLGTGKPPEQCANCEVSFADIAARTLGDHVSMAAVMIDGMYVILCEPCERAYVEKRKDLYGDTRFGWNRKLK